jgi:hypothetical protein
VVLALLAPLTLAAQSAIVTAHVTAATANVRAEAKTNAAILTTLKAGATIEVRNVDGDFYQVTTLVGTVRIQGYVLKRSVTMDKPAAQGAAGASAGMAPKPAATTAPMATAKFGMSAVEESGGKSIPLVAVTARTVQVAERADSPRAAAMALPIGSPAPLPAGDASLVTYLWLIDLPKDARVLGPTPTFTVQFRDAPGISPDDFAPALVSLAVTPSGARVMSVLRGRRDQATRATGDWDVARDLHQDVVKVTVDRAERGVATITPAAALAPGEYALVMRPTGNKKFAGTSVLSPAADGRVFGLAWVFVVK